MPMLIADPTAVSFEDTNVSLQCIDLIEARFPDIWCFILESEFNFATQIRELKHSIRMHTHFISLILAAITAEMKRTHVFYNSYCRIYNEMYVTPGAVIGIVAKYIPLYTIRDYVLQDTLTILCWILYGSIHAANEFLNMNGYQTLVSLHNKTRFRCTVGIIYRVYAVLAESHHLIRCYLFDNGILDKLKNAPIWELRYESQIQEKLFVTSSEYIPREYTDAYHIEMWKHPKCTIPVLFRALAGNNMLRTRFEAPEGTSVEPVDLYKPPDPRYMHTINMVALGIWSSDGDDMSLANVAEGYCTLTQDLAYAKALLNTAVGSAVLARLLTLLDPFSNPTAVYPILGIMHNLVTCCTQLHEFQRFITRMISNDLLENIAYKFCNESNHQLGSHTKQFALRFMKGILWKLPIELMGIIHNRRQTDSMFFKFVITESLIKDNVHVAKTACEVVAAIAHRGSTEPESGVIEYLADFNLMHALQIYMRNILKFAPREVHADVKEISPYYILPMLETLYFITEKRLSDEQDAARFIFSISPVLRDWYRATTSASVTHWIKKIQQSIAHYFTFIKEIEE